MKTTSAFGRQNNMNKPWGFDFVDLTCTTVRFLQNKSDVTFIGFETLSMNYLLNIIN